MGEVVSYMRSPLEFLATFFRSPRNHVEIRRFGACAGSAEVDANGIKRDPSHENEIDFQSVGVTIRFVMLVCHCKRVHCRDIRDAVQNGAENVDEVGEQCGAGTGCGGCRPLVEKMVDRELVTLGRGRRTDVAA